MNRAIDFAYANYHRDFDFDEMADAACFSRFHFHRLFRAISGETPGAFVRRIRLARAASMLRNDPSKSVTDVALSCGFSGSSAFARAFKESCGVSATEFRDARGERAEALFASLRERLAGAESNECKTGGKRGEESFPLGGYLGDETDTARGSMMKKFDYTVEVKELPAMTVAYARHLGRYSGIPEAFGRLERWALPRGHFTPEAKVLAIYHDDPEVTPEAKLRSSACVSVSAGTKAEGDIAIMEVPGGMFAVGHFEIGEGEFGEAWDALLGEWMPRSGWQPDDRMCYELYLNDHETHPERKFIVDICEPVKPL